MNSDRGRCGRGGSNGVVMRFKFSDNGDCGSVGDNGVGGKCNGSTYTVCISVYPKNQIFTQRFDQVFRSGSLQ